MLNLDLPYNNLPLLPPKDDLETVSVLKALSKASRSLGRLKGIDALSDSKVSLLVLEPLLVPESISSNEIEGVHTTAKEFFDAEMDKKKMIGNNKEVKNYRDALLRGFHQIQDRGAFIVNDIVHIQHMLEPNKPGIQSSPGKKIMNATTGKTLYVPPQGQRLLFDLMANIEKYMNDDGLSDVDPLIKMAVIHYQFESIHPFLDGNGRTGRILMILYLVLKDLLDFPLLYLSGYINKYKSDYYRLLQEIRTTGSREEYLVYMMSAIQIQSDHTVQQLIDIDVLIKEVKKRVGSVDGVKYSEAFVMALFDKPSFTIASVEQECGLHRNTIGKYIGLLQKEGLVYALEEKRSHNGYSIKGFREILQREMSAQK